MDKRSPPLKRRTSGGKEESRVGFLAGKKVVFEIKTLEKSPTFTQVI